MGTLITIECSSFVDNEVKSLKVSTTESYGNKPNTITFFLTNTYVDIDDNDIIGDHDYIKLDFSFSLGIEKACALRNFLNYALKSSYHDDFQ
jgi:hypothetical protein